MSRITRTRSGGFSLLELAAVLAVVSILAAVVFLRLDALTERGATVRADELRRNLAHVQQLALGWGVSLRLTVVAANSYSVTCRTASPNCGAGAVGDTAVDPATGDPFTVTLTDSVTLGPVGNTVDFDSLGRPREPTTGILSASNPARTYTLTGGSRTATVTLLPITGFAATSY